jgi:TetR/AcrR family transcriptional regulator, repressor for neighboring sulfatase
MTTKVSRPVRGRRASPRSSKGLRTAEETRNDLIEALLRLLARGSVAGVSVRQIAAEAGVNHGLVHRYFGSKEELVRQAVGRISARVHGEQAREGGLSAASFAVFRKDPVLPLVVARACLDGPHDLLSLAAPPPERLETLTAPLRAALEKLGLAGEIDAHVLNALGTAALLGWFVFRPLLAAGYGLPPHADDRVAALLERLDALLAG